MINEIDASGFKYSIETYEKEFLKILTGIIFCYKMMIKDGILVPANDENRIRDILRKNYLNNRKIRDITGFSGKYNFDREVPEDNDTGRVDIKITTQNTLIEPEAYYIIECKRLDNINLTGSSGLNAEYIKRGILRFVNRKYSSYYGLNGMVGFVVAKMNIDNNIKNINKLLNNYFTSANTKQKLTPSKFVNDFEFSYLSIHIDNTKRIFKIYHLMFDFSENLEEQVL